VILFITIAPGRSDRALVFAAPDETQQDSGGLVFSEDHDFVSYPPAEHHSGIFYTYDKRARLGVPYNGELYVRQDAHGSKTNVQASPGSYSGDLDGLALLYH
jgi:hypothetical protein